MLLEYHSLTYTALMKDMSRCVERLCTTGSILGGVKQKPRFMPDRQVDAGHVLAGTEYCMAELLSDYRQVGQPVLYLNHL